jgi:hypothetical protein
MDGMLTRLGKSFRHGSQGILDGASKAVLENEFGTSNDDEVVLKILEKGDLQEFEVCTIIPFSTPFCFLFLFPYALQSPVVLPASRRPKMLCVTPAVPSTRTRLPVR